MTTFTQVLEHYGVPARTGTSQCPIHQDMHPSMSINVDKEVWKCHVCDLGGTTRHLVAAMENISQDEADTWIADRFGGAPITAQHQHRPGRRRWLPPWRKK